MSLRIATFNVWGLPETFGFGDDVSSRMRVFVQRLADSDLDVLLIQEAWTEEVRTTLETGAEAAGFAVATGVEGEGGLMTLSRRPIEATRFDRFQFRGDPERLAQGEFLGGKGFETTVIAGADGPLTLLNTHLHARYRRHEPRLNSAVRTAQLLEIIRRLHETAGPVVIGGDFNCSIGEPEYEVFRGLSGATELGGAAEFSTLSRLNYYKRHRTGQDKRIDFLFVRPAPGQRWAAREPRLVFAEPAEIREIARSLSDHFGFRAELELGPWGPVRGVATGVPGDPRAIALARSLLEVGRAEADRRERAHSLSALSWAGLAALACGARRIPAIDRRRFLRGSANLGALLALAPALTYGTLARLDSDQKRGAFDDAHAVLAQLEREPADSNS